MMKKVTRVIVKRQALYATDLQDPTNQLIQSRQTKQTFCIDLQTHLLADLGCLKLLFHLWSSHPNCTSKLKYCHLFGLDHIRTPVITSSSCKLLCFISSVISRTEKAIQKWHKTKKYRPHKATPHKNLNMLIFC